MIPLPPPDLRAKTVPKYLWMRMKGRSQKTRLTPGSFLEKKDPGRSDQPEDQTRPRDSVPRQRDPNGQIDSRERKQAKPESFVAEKEKEGMSKDASDSRKPFIRPKSLRRVGKPFRPMTLVSAYVSEKFEEILSEAIAR